MNTEKPYIILDVHSDDSEQKYAPRSHILGYDPSHRRTNLFIFTKGMKLEEKDYDLIFEWKTSEADLEKYDIIPTFMGFLIVTQRVLDVLLKICPDDFQAFPVSINGRNQQTLSNLIDFGEGVEKINFHRKGYYFINVTHTVDAFDRENSIRSRYSGDKAFRGYKKFLFKPGSMGNHHLARRKDLLGMQLISPTLAAELKKHNFKILEFFDEEGNIVQFD